MEDGHEPILRWGFSVGVYSSAQSASAQRSTCVSMIRLSDDWDNPILLWYRRGIQHFFIPKRKGSRWCKSLMSTTLEGNKDNMSSKNACYCSLYGYLMVMIWWAGLGKIPVLAFIGTFRMVSCSPRHCSTSGESVKGWGCDTSLLLGNGHCTFARRSERFSPGHQ